MKINSTEDTEEHERSVVYGLLSAAEVLARGESLVNDVKFKCGEMPSFLFLENSSQDLLPIDIRYMMNLSRGDSVQARSLCERISIAVDAVAGMLVFERMLKEEQLPKEVSGLRPEVVFAVGRYRGSPRERAFAMFRGGPEGIHSSPAPNWREFDRECLQEFASLLPERRPSLDEREAANESLQAGGFKIGGLSERLEQEREKNRKRGRGYCCGM